MAAKLLTAAGGGITLDAASTATDKTLTLPAINDVVLTRTTNVTSGTAVASTSGTSIDFTSIPSWVKRITVMFQSVSTNGTSQIQIQLGAGSFVTSNYKGSVWESNTSNTSDSSGLLITSGTSPTNIWNGSSTISNFGGNIWTMQSVIGRQDAGTCAVAGGSISVGGTLDRIRITTVNGTDTFDAGSINILYE